MSRTEDEEFLARLRATFEIEAGEHLQAIAVGLLQLERAPSSERRSQVLDAVFRAAHSLKGAARAVDFTAIVHSCQTLEDTFAAWRRRGEVPSREDFDSAHRLLDAIRSAMTSAGEPAPQVVAADADEMLAAASPAPAPRAPDSTRERRAPSADTVRVSTAKLDTCLLEAEEMLAVKQAAFRHVRELRALAGRFRGWRKAWSAAHMEALRGSAVAEVDGADTPRLKRLLDFLDWSADCLKSMEHETAVLGRSAEQEWHQVGKLVDDLLEDSKQLLLLPFSTAAASFPRLVRDLCREQGKDAQFIVEGDDTEMDRRVLEEIKDPLVHLLRNAVGHGIEQPEERARCGKPAQGTIALRVSRVEGSKVQLLLSDDGAGIDTRRLREVAARQGVISAAEAETLDEARARALVFHPEVSTSALITHLFGRGLGLAIVREQVEKLGGTAAVEERPGGGTVFRIVVPSTRARFRGVVIEAGGCVMVVPTAQIERAARIGADDLRTVEGRETIALDGAAVALVRLADVLELPGGRREPPAAGTPVIVLGAGGGRVAFAIDAVLDEQEILLKPLRKPLSRVRNVAAATVLASGQVAPILNASDLLRSARRAGMAMGMHGPAAPAAAAASILVAEDSITSRMLLKSMLESAGYRVKVAVDGMEAFTLLRTERFDLLVSDVEMPRLNGFELTARIRADRRLSELPVVLVTALETREDRERGIDAGANAYLAKSGFEQDMLLETVRRLI